jgi:CHASE2 domain-containing sensor protein
VIFPSIEEARMDSRRNFSSSLRLKSVLAVAVWGFSTTLLAWALAFGSYVRFVIGLLIIGIGVRVVAHMVLKRRAKDPPPPWWKM